MSKQHLAAYGGTPTITKDVPHPQWPTITDEIEKAVIAQLHENISIYDRSGIFAEFEDKFAKLHNKKYALLNNSGTNSILAMFVGADLKPGDEVLCPTYTFFATNTPLLSLGLRPVFCDSDQNGNFSVEDAAKRITPKTKAIIITHMWGYLCDMDAITDFANEHKLRLFEDCSHAHLAEYKGRVAGSFGDAAAWSLQGQKNITGGEGGILVTSDQDIQVRATLLGHYNKRCKQEIPKEHPLYKFAVTGMGLKFRAHPIAIAIADEQLRQHDKHQKMRDYCAEQFTALLEHYPFIELLDYSDTKPSWYAFIFKYKPTSPEAPSREQLVDLLHEEGLTEVDIPGSTGPNNKLPLFQNPHELFPQFYEEGESFNTKDDFPNAEQFYSSIIKLPTWTEEEHKEILELYIKGLRKVLDYAGSLQ